MGFSATLSATVQDEYSDNQLHLAAAALFFHRMAGEDALIFQYKDLYISSHLNEHTTFSQLQETLSFSDQRSAVAEITSFEPFQVVFQNWMPEPSLTQWWPGHFETIRKKAEEEPDFIVKRFCFMNDEEKKLVLETWNSTGQKFPDNKTLHSLIEDQCLETPDREAVRFAGMGISYQELNAQANRLSHQLRQYGIGRDKPVAICMERSIDLVIGLLAILKAGGAYVPMDPSYPEERLLYILSDSKAELLLTQESFVSRFLQCKTKTLYIDDRSIYKKASPLNPEPVNSSEDLCYIIYTSGSTGQPKGAANIHKALVNRILWMHRQYGLREEDKVLQKTPFGFDVSVWEFFWPLMTGATLVMAEPGIHKDAQALAELIKMEKITVLHFVPSMLEIFLEAANPSSCTSLIKVFTSGEALSKDLERLFFRKMQAELHNLYGPTEAAIDVTYWPCQKDDSRSFVPIGYPIANTQIFLLDAFFQPVPIGAPGELFIGGVGLAREYIHREQLTRERFITHPFLSGQRLYRTGDLCRYTGDGAIEYLGRLDHQIKLRGFRIELGEIESTLRKHPSIKGAAVIAREDNPGDKFLAAYIITDQKIDGHFERELVSFLGSSLPDYMIPSSFVFLDAFPLSPNGKLDVKNFPRPKRTSRRREDSDQPQTDLEMALQEIWSEVLDTSDIGVLDGFFSLGGHSLQAMRLVLKVRKKLSRRIALPEIFSHSTLRQMADLLEKRPLLDLNEDLLESYDSNRFEPFPLSDIQKAYLIGRTDVFSLGSIHSHVYAENSRNGIDIDRLERVFNLLIERHEMLRAVVLENGVQQILEKTPWYKIRSDQRAREEVQGEMRSTKRRADSWPLFDIRVSADSIHFFFDLLIADGRGLEVLFEELSSLYENEACSLPPIRISYRDCVLSMERQELDRAKQYWHSRLPTLPDAPELPRAPSSKAGPFRRLKAHLTDLEWKRVQNRAAQVGVSSAAYLATLYGEALKTHARSAHFTLNLMFFNRPPLHPDVDRLVANFSSTLLLEMDLRGSGSLGSKAQKVQRQLLEDLEHAAFNGIKVLNEKNRREGGSTAAAMPIVFACALNLGAKRGRFAWYGERVPYSHLETPQVLLDHQVFEEKEGGLCIHWDVREGYFSDGIIEAMFRTYLDLVKEEKQETRTNAIVSQHCTIADECLHEAFFKQAFHRPERIAILSKNSRLTYGQLAAYSLDLAQRLQKLHLKADDLVAVIMDKGWEQAGAVLGIHAAGAAYLPIDAALPEERIKQILSISQTRAAVVQKSLAFDPGIPCFTLEQKERGGPFTCVQKPSDLAYVIFTSGSTGIPKGVMIEHRAALNTLETLHQKYGIKENDRCFAISSLSFDLSVFDLYGMLRIGASLYLPGKEETPDNWLNTVQDHGITIWNSTPSLMQILIDQATLRPPENSKLRIVMMSGDWIPVPLPNRIRHTFAANIYSLGGATEASIWSNDYPIQAVDSSWTSIPYGKALANQTMLILDEDLEPRPYWATGMIYIGGSGLARGYLGDSKKTSKSFIIHPQTKERLYRTGDLGRLHPDGNIEFLGREDLQAKVQGYRIELEEIEAAIHQFEGIQQIAVRIAGEKSEAKTIAAFFTASQIIDTGALEKHLQNLLPAYMIPHRFIQVEALTLTANGKIDTKALLSLLSSQTNATTAFAPPATPLEQKMAELWSSLLNVSSIGRNDRFFALGGTSFHAFRLVYLIQKELNLSISISDLFQRGTIKELCVIQDSTKKTALSTLQLNGSKTALFLVHPSGGGILCYAELAARITDHPVFAFQAPGYLDGQPHLQTIEEMAEHYLAQLLTKQSDGPYFLGGWSLGGSVAYEMACRLKKMGKKLEPLLLIDAPSPYAGDEPSEAELRHFFAEDFGEILSSFDESSKESLFSLFRNNVLALRAYCPPKEKIDLIQWKAEILSLELLCRHPDKEKADWGWDAITSGQIEIKSCSATHSSILQMPCVQELSSWISHQ